MSLRSFTIRRSIPFIVFVVFLNPIAVTADNVAWSPTQEIMPFKQMWSGTALPNELLSAAPTSSYIADATSWARLWHAWRGGERLPEVDFDKESIVVCTAISPNMCGVNVSVNQHGALKVAPVRTLIASHAKTFNYQIGLIEREKIKSIEWMAIAPEWNRSVPGEPGAGTSLNSDVVQQLKQASQELLDAIAPGKKEVWEKYLAEGSIYADEEGRVLTKDELLKELTPLPAGYIGSIKMGDAKVLVQDNVIVLSHLDREELELYGQKIVTNYHATDTWAKQSDGQWRRVSTQVMAIPNERKPAKIDSKVLDAYLGQYQLSPEVTYTISREGERLFGQRTGRNKEELLPLCVDIFYRKGIWRGEKVFDRDAQGVVVRMLDRRENNDLVWKKIR